MFEEYTRGLIKRLDDVTKFSTLVGDMIKRTNNIFTDVVNCTTEGDFDDTICRIYDIHDTDELTQSITINACISEVNKEYKPFVCKIRLTVQELMVVDEEHADICNTVSTDITIYPGGQVYIPNGIGPQNTSNIYRQNNFHRAGRPSEISVGNFDKTMWPIEYEIDPDNEEDFKLKSDWDRGVIRQWFDEMMKSIDEIYDTDFYVDETGVYDIDRIY